MKEAMVKAASPHEESNVTHVLMLAFSTDPGARWTWPDSKQYLSYFAEMVHPFAGKAFEQGSAFCTEGYGGAALWLPPGMEPDLNAMTALFERSVPAMVQSDLQKIFEKVEKFHPKEPHWYLPLIGVDPFLQGKGIGSALLKHAVQICDRDNAFAFLESANPRNVALYQRHGFEVMDQIQVGTSPVFFPMIRKPQKTNQSSISN